MLMIIGSFFDCFLRVCFDFGGDFLFFFFAILSPKDLYLYVCLLTEDTARRVPTDWFVCYDNVDKCGLV